MAPKIEEVYARFDSDLRSFVSARVRDPDATEDVLQDVYLKIHTRIDTIENEERIAAWVYRIARNTVYDFYRSRRPTRRLDALSPIAADPTEDGMEQRLSKTVRDMLNLLPPEHRSALYLTEYEGLTQRALAERLGISLSGAKSRVQRARTRLKILLLDCCHFELDRHGKVINYYDREHDTRHRKTPRT